MLVWGRVRSELCFKESQWFHELAQCSWNRDYDEDKYPLLVRLILWWVRGFRSNSLLVYLVLLRRLGPALDTEVL